MCIILIEKNPIKIKKKKKKDEKEREKNKEDKPQIVDIDNSEINKKKNLTVPRNLYSNGLYYVSSILGLGSKVGDTFVSRFNKEKYVKNKDDYLDVNSVFYKQLHKLILTI